MKFHDLCHGLKLAKTFTISISLLKKSRDLTQMYYPISSDKTLRQTQLYVEWILLLSNFLQYCFGTYLKDRPELWPILIVFTIAFFGLSFIFPTDRPLWQRRAYIAIEILLVLGTQWMQVSFGTLMYLILVKSCLLLSRRDVFLTVFLTGVGFISEIVWSYPQHFARTVAKLQSQGIQTFYQPQVVFRNNLTEYIGVSLFVVLMGFVMVAEQKSRKRAEALALEVETLAATLERTRIARDIHDSLGHTLTSLDVQLELAQKLCRRDPTKAVETINTAKLLASQCLQDTRQAVQTMRQSPFDLNNALSTLVSQIQSNQQFEIQTQLNLPPLPLQASRQLYCIVQEGLTNIQRHAQATRVQLQGKGTEEGIQIKLIDNGCGFDPLDRPTGFGLRGMQERVQMLGGKLTIDSSPDQGTEIEVWVPR
jgi:signal transduction histidine kinase